MCYGNQTMNFYGATAMRHRASADVAPIRISARTSRSQKHRIVKGQSAPAHLSESELSIRKNELSNNVIHSRSASSWGLVGINSLPDFLNDNEFLLNHHRPELKSAVECLKSAFRLHTETWNIWTHFLGSVASLFLCVYYLKYVAEDWAHRLVFLVYFSGAVFCMGTSATYHVFICHSEPVCRFLAKMDYCGVIILISTSYVPWLHFAFYCYRFVKLTYIGLVSALAIACISVVVQDQFRQPSYRWLRFGLFLFLSFVGVIPFVHFLLLDYILMSVWSPPVLWMMIMAAVYLTGGLAYASCIPERIFPGRCDIWCQSHQILHVCVIGGVISCFLGASELASARLMTNPNCLDVRY